MRWVAVMPLRASCEWGQENITRKMAGRPLFAWALEQAIASECFDAVYIATELPEIRNEILRELPGSEEIVKILNDPAVIGAGKGGAESALLEFQQKVPFDAVCMIDATSPLVRADDFRAAKHKFLAENLDLLLTAVRSKRPFWTRADAPVRYPPMKHPVSQDREEYLMENGAFYITHAKALTEHRSRLSDRIGIHEMSAKTAIELTDEAGWITVERLLTSQKLASVKARARQVKALVLDVDGTLTDAGMYYGPAGEALKKFNTRDAHGLQLLREHGMAVCVISTEDSPAVEARMKKLRIDEYYPGVANKLPLLLELAKRWDISIDSIGYIGDDLSDLECLSRAGSAFCPADAVPQVVRQVHYICECSGGHGAVREVCDLILESKEAVLQNYSEAEARQ